MRKLEKLNDYIYVLYGTGSSNIYFINCQKKAVVDTGHPREINNNIEAFKKNGIDITKIDYIINTHSHGDHVGGNAYLKKTNQNIKIIGSKKSLDFQTIRKRISILKGAEDDFDDYNIDIFINDNDVIDLGEIKLNAISTPGHTIDSISYFVNEYNWILSGDTIYLRLVTQLDYYQNLQKSLNEIIDTYNKLKNLNIKKFLTGHGPVIDDPQNIDNVLKKLQRFKAQPEMIIINNLIPSAEHYIYKNPGKNLDEIKEYFINNMLKFKNEPFYTDIAASRFSVIIDKLINLMLIMNIIKCEEEKIFLKNDLNQLIGFKK